MGRVLTHAEARAVYDRIGRWQDTQSFYEAPALADLTVHADFTAAHRVVEFGCGTGRFAARLLAEALPPDARYVGVECSPVMSTLARQRLRPWADRAVVHLTDGTVALPESDGAADRVLATYVLDLLNPDDTARFLAEAARVLTADGRLGLISLTDGQTPLARVVTWGWRRLFALRPALVGGCRPIRLLDLLSADRWRVLHRAVVTARGVSSEIVVAMPGGP